MRNTGATRTKVLKLSFRPNLNPAPACARPRHRNPHRSRRMHPSLMPRKKGTLPSGFARERERGLHAPAGRAEAGRALASRHLGVAHAARDRLLPAGRLPRGGLSGRFPHARPERHLAHLHLRFRGPAPPRPRRQGVGRARRLTSGRVHGRAVSGTAVGAGRPAMSYCFGSAKMLISRLASSAEVKSLTYSSTKKSFTSMFLASR